MRTKYRISLKMAYFIVFSIYLSLTIGCKKLIEVDLPIDQYTAETVYSSTSTATLALTGIYAKLRKSNLAVGANNGVALVGARLSDELKGIGSTDSYQLNSVTSQEADFIWPDSYLYFIYRANALIEGINQSKTIPADSKQILVGEAKFIRAFTYFYLVNFYGDVPLVLTIDVNSNTNIGRTAKDEVYAQIIIDLKEAQSNLKDGYLSGDLSTGTNERLRPNRSTATALLARVYLYLNKWQDAEIESTKVINNSDYELLPDVNAVFLKNSKEAIWQLEPESRTDGYTNTIDGLALLPKPGDRPSFALSSILSDSFEAGDLRKSGWTYSTNINSVDYYIPYKYKVGRNVLPPQEQTEYQMMFRLGEQYLIRAEARAKLGKLLGNDGAEGDVNKIRSRAGLLPTTARGQDDLLNTIAQERRVELFTEGGHRWFDLKRTGKIDEVMSIVSPTKGGSWSSYKALLPIPHNEFLYNSALRGHQNPGYSE